jgi:hypothetical protein
MISSLLFFGFRQAPMVPRPLLPMLFKPPTGIPEGIWPDGNSKLKSHNTALTQLQAILQEFPSKKDHQP